MRIFTLVLVVIEIGLLFSGHLNAQKIDRNYINLLKEDRRGPYAGIKWFCEDGSMREARDPCPEPMEGVQHAIYKDRIKALAADEHLYVDQILTGTEYEDFWDANHQQSRVKQYQMTNFLYDADDGWILEKAKNYRGAKQIEDEQAWGQEFLEWAVTSNARLRDNYLLIKLAAIDIPHGEDTRISQRVRAYSKLLAEEESSFMEERTVIHNNPSSSDLAMVQEWKKKNTKLSAKASEYLNLLLTDMKVMYKPFEVEDLLQYSKPLTNSTLKKELNERLQRLKGSSDALLAMEASDLLLYLRENLLEEMSPKARVSLIDLINQVEQLAKQHMQAIDDETLGEMREKSCYLSNAIYGAGYLETWEYDKLKQDLDWMQADTINIQDLEYFKYALEKMVIWSSQMIQSLYTETVHQYADFEPLAHGLVDDKIRSSLILPAGQLVQRVNSFFDLITDSKSQFMGSTNVAGVQGLNPGFAKGRLYVLSTLPEGLDLDKEGIYAFDRPPADMKPVAGILNVKEGNPVSHIQLLARNLAIPNALISSDILSDLKRYDGEEIFYAVSPKGTIIVKKTSDMTSSEQDLFSTKSKEKERITISTDELVLHPDSLLDMSEIDASYSGKWCGPKAANLGQLKQMFPEHVVEGLVIPFGVFKDHMMQQVPGQDYTYWGYLQKIFSKEKNDLAAGMDTKQVEKETLRGLSELRNMIEDMPLKPAFVRNLRQTFRDIMGEPLGQIPVFLRSDTNMEDLPQFTGAGLNLTLFNVVDRQKILDGIKKVWASPYTERSYQWRQQYLDNPEEVYPSILIIPSVNVDRSGVIITKGVSRGGDDEVSISFSRGVGGAVEGQSAESYVIYPNGYAELISPGRETKYRTIPPSGGSTFKFASFNEPILDMQSRKKLYEMAQSISNKMDKIDGGGHAYDIELGIKDEHIWLFQVRPFVENKDALGSDYLRKIDPTYENLMVFMTPQK